MCIAIRIYLYVIIYDTLEPKLNHDQEQLITKPLAQNPWLETPSKMMQSIDALRDAYLDLGSTSRVWIKVDATLGTRLAYALQTFLSQKLHRTLEHSPDLASLISYQSDTTSFLTRVCFSCEFGGASLRREGKELTEFRIERLYVLTLHPTDDCSAILLTAPRMMSAGKKNWNLFTAASDILPVGRCTARGIVVVHAAFDRAVNDGVSKMLEALEDVRYLDFMKRDPFVETGWGVLLQWYVNTPCPYHDCHGGFRKALEPYASKEDVKDLHISIESLRNSFSMIAREIPKFSRLHVQFANLSAVGVADFWARLGITPDQLHLLVLVNPCWTGTVLLVSTDLQCLPDPLGVVQNAILLVLKLSRFSESRFLGAGMSNRALQGAYAIGVWKIVELAREVPSNSEYYIHGFDKLTPVVRKMSCIACLVSYVPEKVLGLINKDERIMKNIDDVERALHEAIEYVVATLTSTWERLADMIAIPDYGWRDLAADTIASTHVCAGHIERHLLRNCRGYPWCLARGDIRENLQNLASSDHPPLNLDAGCGAKAREMLCLGYPMSRVVAAVTLLLFIIWGTRAVEQGHGSTAVTKKAHPYLTSFILAIRSLLHQARTLFNIPKDIATKLERKLAIAYAIRFSSQGRGAFFRELTNSILERVPSGARAPPGLMNEILRQHGRLYRALPVEARMRYDQDASKTATERRERLDAYVDTLQIELDNHYTTQQQRNLDRGKTNIVSHHRLTDDELEQLLAVFNSAECQSNSATLMNDHLRPPEKPNDAVIELIETSFLPRPTRPEHRTWQKRLCYYRGEVSLIAFGLDVAEGSRWYLFLFAMQQPLEPWFLEATMDRDALPIFGRAASGPCHAHRFILTRTPPLRYDEMQLFTIESGVLVISGSSFTPQGAVVSNSAAQPLDAWEEDWPLVSRTRTHAGRARVTRYALEGAPAWVRQLLATATTRTDDGGGGGTTEDGGGEPVDLDSILRDCWDEIEEGHRHYEPPPVDGDEFFTRLRHGSATREFAVGAEARQGVPREFCKNYGLQQATSFTTGDLYTVEQAISLSTEWCDIMQHFYNLWAAHADFSYEFSPAELGSYVPSDEWRLARASMAAGSSAARRAAGFDEIRPKLPRRG